VHTYWRVIAYCCSVVQGAAVWCSVVQCVAVCCSVLQCVAVCCSVLLCVAVCQVKNEGGREECVARQHSFWDTRVRLLQCVAVCCSVLQCGTSALVLGFSCQVVAVSGCCSVFLRCSIATLRGLLTRNVCCSVLQCVAGRCSVLQHCHSSFACQTWAVAQEH